MNDPKRIVEDCTALEARVIGSAALDVPPKSFHEGLHAALLVGGAVGAASAGVGAASANAAHATAAATSATSSGVIAAGVTGGSLVALKWVAVVVLAGAVSVGVHAKMASTTVATPAATEAAHPRAMPLPAREIPPPPVPTDPAAAEEAVPVTVTPPVARIAAEPSKPLPSSIAAAASPSETAPSVADDLPRELALVDEARTALAAGDSSRVIERLDRHDLDYAKPHLAAEVLALRVEAYAQRHDAQRVGSLMEVFLAKYPEHPLGKRMRMLAGGGR